MEQISIKNPKQKFQEFLQRENNHRIVFSGMFGSGKTTFLNSFFKSQDSLAIHLFPTNYSVGKNEDIFELIKFDILYELLKHEPELEKFKLDKSQGAYLAFAKKGDLLIEPMTALVEATSEIGKSVSQVFKTAFLLNKAIKEEIEKTKEEDGEDIREFAQKMFEQIGNPYESDLYTELIKRLLQNVKEKEKKRDTILIIDDLDRIDPDQVFRLLNVFSVHFDVEGAENKFDFDKILFCCDANNIRRIFHNRFGIDVDFNGYFDKFYSTEIFHFDNKSEVKKKAHEILLTIKPTGNVLWDKSKIHPSEAFNFEVIRYFIENMIISETFNLRQLKKLFGCVYDGKKYVINDIFRSPFFNEHIHIAVVFDFMISLFESTDGFLNAVKRTHFSKTNSAFSYGYDRFVGDLVMLCDYKSNKFNPAKEFEYTSIKYQIQTNNLGNYSNTFFANVNRGNNVDWLDSVELDKLIQDAILTYYTIRGETVYTN